MFRDKRLLGAASALVLVALLSVACGGRGSQRSVGSFCSELVRGAGQLDKQTKDAPKTGARQFGLFLQNMGDFNRLLHRLDARAPRDIASDMNQVVKVFDDAANRAGEAAKNPLGALASGLVSSVLAGPSVEAVDSYAQKHCGRKLFGPSR